MATFTDLTSATQSNVWDNSHTWDSSMTWDGYFDNKSTFTDLTNAAVLIVGFLSTLIIY